MLVERRLSPLAFAGAAIVIVFQLACPIVLAAQGSNLSRGQYATQSDAARYRAVAQADGTAYRDFDVEYPPLAYGLFRAVGPRTFDGFREHLFALQVLGQALVVLLLFRFWGRRAMWSYLALSAPMLFVVYSGFDLVAVALAVGGATLVRLRYPTSGALAFVTGAFVKLWPLVLLPSVLVRRQTRALATALAAGAVGLVGWALWGGPSAVGQVVTYRGARGWEYESLPGSMLRLVSGQALHFESGSWRVGAPPKVAGAFLALVAVTAIAAIWRCAWRRARVPDGVAETAAITALLTFGTLLSPQFVIWLLPFVAMAAAGGAPKLERWAGAALLLTLLDWIIFSPAHPGFVGGELVILARNGALVGLFIVSVVALRTATPSQAEPDAASPKVPVAG